MRKIPQKLRDEIADDPYMKKCVCTQSTDVSWQHCWIYAGKQINEAWAIVPLRRDLNTSHPPIDVQVECKFASLQRAKELGLWEDIKKRYPKKDWDQEYNYICQKLHSIQSA